MQNTTPFQIYNASAGSGKTFTIVKEYLKILLQSNDLFKFQQILAITFTNKAAGEMKERILNTLQNFSENKGDDMLPIIAKELTISKEEIEEKSSKILQNILNNYSAFNISTIDSFTYKLIKTFAFDLNLSASANVELDASVLLNEAVDLVISKIGENEDLTKILVAYSLQKIDSDKDWDISTDLKNFAQLILNENHFEHFKEIEELSISTFTNLKNELNKANKEIEAKFIELGEKGSAIINEIGLEKSYYSGGGDLPNHFNKLKNFKFIKVDELKFEGRLNTTIEEQKNLFATKCNAAEKDLINQYSTELTSIYEASKELYNQHFSTYILNKLIVESLIPLAVLNYIYQSLQDIKNEKDVLLNAEFNKIISDSIKNEPAPFIYERLGEKFRYYFIDEMQDTSQLQWQNLIPLIDHAVTSENALGEIGKLVLVGDAKQSIYRWRGGKAEQFMELSSNLNTDFSNPFVVEKQIHNLPFNFRSYPEVIDFNNQFFSFISNQFKNKSYNQLYVEGNAQQKQKKEGGFVQLSFVDKNLELENPSDVFSEEVYNTILQADKQYKRSEICILTRTKKQGVDVANYLTERDISIISSETLLLANHKKVNFLIYLLQAFDSPNNKEIRIELLYFIYDYFNISEEKHQFIANLIHLKTADFYSKLSVYGITLNTNEVLQLSLYDGVEHLIRTFNLTKTSDAHLQFFLDVVLEFQQQHGSSIRKFLEYWELKKDGLSIVAPEAENAIRVMTIHKAKGLEFPVVIYPFDTAIYYNRNDKVWYNLEKSKVPKVLINNSQKLEFAG
ncbi:MAG TPA: UvrD-helicase domain-containing protein, partial [Flavobacteriaceae bacterium]|nr:UvrD-helicase domain-containing protein [Flavobacteriaceae bacterium]